MNNGGGGGRRLQSQSRIRPYHPENLETPLLDVPITIRDQETSQVGLETS